MPIGLQRIQESRPGKACTWDAKSATYQRPLAGSVHHRQHRHQEDHANGRQVQRQCPPALRRCKKGPGEARRIEVDSALTMHFRVRASQSQGEQWLVCRALAAHWHA